MENGSSSTRINGLAGSPSHYKNGVLFTGTTRDSFFDAFAVNSDLIAESHAVDMTAWVAQTRFGSFGAGYETASRLYGAVILTIAQTTDNRNNLRSYLASKSGVIL